MSRRLHCRLKRHKLALAIPNVPGFRLGRLAPVDVRAKPKLVNLLNKAGPLSATLARVRAFPAFALRLCHGAPASRETLDRALAVIADLLNETPPEPFGSVV